VPTGRHPPRDPYSRVDYRRLIAWEKRIAREEPFLRALLDEAPERSLLDVGCGTGEHVAHFAKGGVRALGVDASESMIEKAREHEARGEGRFLLGDATALPEALAEEPPFGLAICLGNMLPHLREETALHALADGVHRVLRPGGLFLLQLLNYRRILQAGVRHLPVNVTAGEKEGEEIVFLRLLRAVSERSLLFFPTTLVLEAENEDEPVRVASSRRVELRPWGAEDLSAMFAARGWSVRPYGGMAGEPFEPASSPDLVLVARRG
jgi:glycine/sarcosine N-methyltransferase